MYINIYIYVYNNTLYIIYNLRKVLYSRTTSKPIEQWETIYWVELTWGYELQIRYHLVI